MQNRPLKDWMQQVPPEDRKHYLRIGMLSALDPGARSALIVVDVTLGFCGREGLSLEEATREFSTACGPAAWEALPRVARLIGLFRDAKQPIIYTFPDTTSQSFTGSVGKSSRPNWPPPHYNDFPDAIAPRDGEWVMGKAKASGFFQTPLPIYLTKLNIDTLVICGVSTSGCVRATSVDASSFGYRTFVVDDCCFDRSYYAHCANLFDLHAKYATVVSLGEVVKLMSTADEPGEAALSAAQ
jgi:maleamate amidohydrolase